MQFSFRTEFTNYCIATVFWGPKQFENQPILVLKQPEIPASVLRVALESILGSCVSGSVSYYLSHWRIVSLALPIVLSVCTVWGSHSNGQLLVVTQTASLYIGNSPASPFPIIGLIVCTLVVFCWSYLDSRYWLSACSWPDFGFHFLLYFARLWLWYFFWISLWIAAFNFLLTRSGIGLYLFFGVLHSSDF